ncbi:UDP-N-acetylmuramoyl-L-alanyl-D-glutamate--2,6-diaminopimelate ligase [Brevibacterium casei]|uniref:UDP-N-acetylmuramoyl-L-alanyl-D-glutamate--2,6-diaminopimelate ligase n=1 Tax=Brevibacterium casei TaxID=33889 RepID=A0A449D4D2_9MICO|nr:UDP-N-acetylmuramoyl-L-alanyl-D-glutamate--2,6-diaminopimelate ligase [Brevibacterium casei]MCT1551507.1 UDP-N-acetylmuramoyl-L-alanyl-D-glutamate--2,6-diaminopimelate ligase [Brevibacterium casei]MCT1560926.1 UDP-N-acetylmuramoyl-L-alanyl-D-glutamate--2,6-diaminopimelate ligase [Brevibacterium casei]MCT2209266.1 UDP-N-acetylmuramoyl-L-alanyl-D-glutamate--2,6-diaminopimelate ligase [Brevibacterium casei]QPS33096.1 UDP-N-acetylmuramoyl-L-alanyl-D-glutamate--2,6-diaminopimelate ligase [Breviba
MMRISQLLPAAPGTIHGDPDREVSGVSHDSRTVAPGQLYAALPGSNVHGARFAPDLIAAGVSAILTDPVGWKLIAEAVDPDVLAAVTGLVVDDPRAVLGFVSATVYGTDVRPELLGVTGTNGKTTTTYLLAGMLEALGRRTGVIGTVATLIDGTAVPAVRTTPEAPELHALFAKMRAADVDTCAMEVSSHALSQHRVDGAHFAVAGFTNLSQDHLDFHHSMDEYFAAKAALFTRAFADRAVIVIEDEWGERMAAAAQIPVTTLGRDDRSRLRIDHTPGESDFSLRLGEGETIPLRSPLPGDFNVTNTALAAAMLVESGIPATELSAIGRTFTAAVPGRMEVIGIAEDAAHELPRAIVDYSHTPDAIAKALASLDADSDELVIVVGAGGDRDPGKRHGMGAAAARGADVIVLTDDNPRSEDPAAIRAAVRAGIDAEIAAGGARVKKVIEIGDRGEAIDKAIVSASPATTVLIAGKGHETGQSAGGVVTEFDDRSRTRSALTARLGRPETGKVHS